MSAHISANMCMCIHTGLCVCARVLLVVCVRVRADACVYFQCANTYHIYICYMYPY